MKNKEKYAKEIMKVACGGDSIAVTKGSERIVPCGNIYCDECLFASPIDCVEEIRKWAEQEYIEKPVISKRDRTFLDYLDTIINYITRDADGALFVHISKPHKLIDGWEGNRCEVYKSLRFFELDFPMVKWEDDKPWLIEDLKKLEVVDEYEK